MNCSKLTLNLFKRNGFKQIKNALRCCSSATVASDNLVLKIGKSVEHFPLVWLRDNCTCKECFHQDSFSRIIDWNKFDTNVGVKKVETNKTNDEVLIEWNDNHRSSFNFEWLIRRSFKEKGDVSGHSYRPEKVLWTGSDFTKIAKKYDYGDLMTSDKSLCNWIKDLAIHGVVFVENAGLENDANRKLAERTAFIRKTHYEEEFRVTSKTTTSNVAYLSSALQLHTDLPYYEYVPGIINLHCITQAEGEEGKSLLCDGFYVAEVLRKHYNEAFKLLSTVKVNWLDIGEDEGKRFHSDFRTPMIGLDALGNIQTIRHSVPQRDSHFSVHISVVKPWYQALKVFLDMLNKHSTKFKLKPGEMLTFDNTRIIHGREGYKDTDNKHRFVIGLYMDWDELYSKLKVSEQNAIT